jgi:hypothetical protein
LNGTGKTAGKRNEKKEIRNIPFSNMKILILIPMPYDPPQKPQQVSNPAPMNSHPTSLLHSNSPLPFSPFNQIKQQHERTYNDKAASNNSSPPAPSATPSDHASSEFPTHSSPQEEGEPISLIGGRCIALGCRGARCESGRCGMALCDCLNCREGREEYEEEGGREGGCLLSRKEDSGGLSLMRYCR